MNKIDCDNIYNFKEEWERRNRVDAEAGWNRLIGLEGYNPFAVPKESLASTIRELQKWSDEHPRMTRREKFEKMCEENGFEDCHIEYCEDNYPFCKEECCDRCQEYWDEFV